MNKKSTKERTHILNLLIECNSLRATSRIAGCSINTVTKLLVETGEACARYQHKFLVNLPCKRIQVDEIWSFGYAKQKTVTKGKDEAGDVWIWTAIDTNTKIVPSWRIGHRDEETEQEFIYDLASRMANKIQIEPEKHQHHLSSNCNQTRHLAGSPGIKYISKNFAKKHCLTMSLGKRGFTQSTNGLSYKIKKYAHAIALHFMDYNFVRIHKDLKVSPAMAVGVSNTLWNLEKVIQMVDSYWREKSM